ncbi:MAG: anhydro-N-acetylmuramic acid kinase [Saprospiraceae bacterium]
MNQNIAQLYKISQKEYRYILGLMSGTSLDGLDVALCRFKGSGRATKVELLHFESVPYTEDIKSKIRSVFARPNIDLPYLCLLNEWIGLLYGEIVLQCLESWGISASDVDIVASHGQTIMHCPRSQHSTEDFGNGTLQIGDGDHIAVKSGVITLSDFRQKHIAVGGEGAPLAVYGDYLLFSEKSENRIMLNIGGIGNFTFLPSVYSSAKVMVSDTGPGNTIMDAYCRKYKGVSFDAGGSFSQTGTINELLLNALISNDFFSLPYPKSTGPELFNLGYLEEAQRKSNTGYLSSKDVMATLNRFSAWSIAKAIKDVIVDENVHVYVSGGGWHNLFLIENLKELLPGYKFKDLSELGIPGDAKEAVLFAALANEALCGDPSLVYTDKGLLPVSMGKISFPK